MAKLWSYEKQSTSVVIKVNGMAIGMLYSSPESEGYAEKIVEAGNVEYNELIKKVKKR